MILGTLWQLAKKSFADWLDPVYQNPDALLYATYKNVPVRLVPVYNGTRIERWVPDPAVVKAIDEAAAAPPPLPTPTAPTAPTTPTAPAAPVPPLP